MGFDGIEGADEWPLIGARQGEENDQGDES
jgi:hypothetical protein